MMTTTSIVQEATAMTPAARSTATTAAAVAPPSAAIAATAISPHVLIVGKKNAADYIAPALFRLGSFGELVVKAKGSLSIVTAVNVAEMVKRDVAGLMVKPVKIGTEELVIDGATRRVSYIEIHLARPALTPAAAVPEQLSQTAAKSKRIRKAATTKKKTAAATARKKKAAETPAVAAVTIEGA